MSAESEADDTDKSVSEIIDDTSRRSSADFSYVNVSASVHVYVPCEISELDEELLEERPYGEDRMRKEIAERKAARAMSEEYGVDNSELRSETTVEKVKDRAQTPDNLNVAEKWRVSFVVQE